MIHWKELGTKGRIEAIRQVWFSGCSTAQIAAHFQDATRNAVIGVYHRHGRFLIDKPLNARSAINEASRKSKKRRTSRAAPIYLKAEPLAQRPLPKPREYTGEAHLCGKPLMLLQAKECRFAVNDAVRDELHLFCGRPTERSYCAHHRLRAYRPSNA